MDPTKVGEALGQAQDIQQVLGIVIGLLLLALLAVVKFWLDGRKAWAEEKLALVTGHKDEAAGAKAEWAAERQKFVERERDLIEAHADKIEEKSQQMLEVSLAVEKVLDNLSRWKESQDGPSG